MTEKEQLLTQFLTNIRDHMDGERLPEENLIGIVFDVKKDELKTLVQLYPDILEYVEDEFHPNIIINGVVFCLDSVCCSDRFIIAWQEDMPIDTLLTHYSFIKKNTLIPCSLDISCKMCYCS